MKFLVLASMILLNTSCSFASHNKIFEESIPNIEVTLQRTKMITLKEYAVAKADDENPILATFGVQESTAVGIYNYETKKAALAHCDLFTSNVHALKQLIDEVAGGSDYSDIKIYLFSQSMPIMAHTHAQINSMSVQKDSITVIVGMSSHAVGINAQTGDFFKFDFDHTIHDDGNLSDRLDRITLNITNKDLLLIG